MNGHQVDSTSSHPQYVSLAAPRLHLFVEVRSLEGVLQWLAERCGVTSRDVASLVYAEPNEALIAAASRSGIPAVPIENLDEVAQKCDAILAAGDNLGRRVGMLFSRGYHNVYNGDELLARSSAYARFVDAARDCFVGPVPPGEEQKLVTAQRFPHRGLTAGEIPRDVQFVVNSIPKSGTLWFAGMLGSVLGIEPGEQVVVSHVGDVEIDRRKYNNYGTVTLVRDLRDVVVSWFHHAARSDSQLGFREPRYKTVEQFYWEWFLGTIHSSDRYYHGDFCGWINRNCADYVPLVRYEDLRADPLSVLLRVLNAWRVNFSIEDARQACEQFSYGRLMREPCTGNDYVSQQYRLGHLRRAEPGGWNTELPAEIVRDIEVRFQHYQQRLGYCSSL